MNSISPVLTEVELESEQVIALDQPEYYPIIVVRAFFEGGIPATLTRFRFSEREKELIAKGADLILSQPHHGSLMPVGLQLAMPNEYPQGEENELPQSK